MRARAASLAVLGAAVLAPSVYAQSGLDYEFYRDNVEPIFIQSRGDFTPPDPGDPACVLCHTWQTSTPLMLQPLEDDADGNVFWTEAQSRENFAAVSQLVSPGNPDSSRLLLAPLSAAAGGTVLHTGGKVWESRDDPEWRTIAQWVMTGSASGASGASIAAAPEVDYEFFEACVHPIFYRVTTGGLACASCHSAEFTQADPQVSWNAVQRLIEPGHPTRSRLIMHPLHPDGGGDYVHNGVRRWLTQSDPEFRMLAGWINGDRTGAQCGL